MDLRGKNCRFTTKKQKGNYFLSALLVYLFWSYSLTTKKESENSLLLMLKDLFFCIAITKKQVGAHKKVFFPPYDKTIKAKIKAP
jgi:hypothetical protein